jgi:hypothetical protein
VQNLLADIVWHQQQIKLIRKALADAVRSPDEPAKAIELEALQAALMRLERTLAHLEELQTKRT